MEPTSLLTFGRVPPSFKVTSAGEVVLNPKKRVCVEAAAHHFEIGYVRYWFIIPIAWFDITPSSPSSIRYEPTYGTPPV